jgi:transposase InsO family protein
MGFRALWRWKSRPHGGRPRVSTEIRSLIREMSRANPLWAAPRIHGELKLLGIDVAQSTVAKYMAKRCGSPSQGWKTFLRNHADGIASCDFLIVPALGFRLLYAFVVLGQGRRKLLHAGVTAHPTAQWTARQLCEAFPWERAPAHLIRDNDAIYGHAFKKQLAAMGIRDGPTALRSPWQNGYVERLIGSIRRECLDHMTIRDEGHLRRVLKAYANYYNTARTHLGLQKNSPIPRTREENGRISSRPHLGGLHHEYVRI